jgi:hypothetical protein
MISARNYKAPHFFDSIKVSSFLKINNQNLVYFYGLILNGWVIITLIIYCQLYLIEFKSIDKSGIYKGRKDEEAV